MSTARKGSISNGSVLLKTSTCSRRPGVRVVQLTPVGSACSIGMGTGLPAYDEMAPGTIKGLHLVVADIEQARAELAGRGVEVGAVEDVGGGVKYAWLADPDGNTLTLQEMAWRTGDKF
jgi:predicted enzyme related to lactoylglutathione lyase